MRRVEPKLGDLELASNPAEVAALRTSERRRRRNSSLLSWAYTVVLLALLFVGVPWAALYFGAIGQSEGAALDVILPRALILGGLGLVLFSQLVGVVMLFSVSVVKGALSVFVPGYWLFALRREGMYWSVVGILLLGIAAYAAGIVLAS